jgi:hypothetical protein
MPVQPVCLPHQALGAIANHGPSDSPAGYDPHLPVTRSLECGERYQAARRPHAGFEDNSELGAAPESKVLGKAVLGRRRRLGPAKHRGGGAPWRDAGPRWLALSSYSSASGTHGSACGSSYGVEKCASPLGVLSHPYLQDVTPFGGMDDGRTPHVFLAMCIIWWTLMAFRQPVKQKKPLEYVTYGVLRCTSLEGKSEAASSRWVREPPNGTRERRPSRL